MHHFNATITQVPDNVDPLTSFKFSHKNAHVVTSGRSVYSIDHLVGGALNELIGCVVSIDGTSYMLYREGELDFRLIDIMQFTKTTQPTNRQVITMSNFLSMPIERGMLRQLQSMLDLIT